MGKVREHKIIVEALRCKICGNIGVNDYYTTRNRPCQKCGASEATMKKSENTWVVVSGYWDNITLYDLTIWERIQNLIAGKGGTASLFTKGTSFTLSKHQIEVDEKGQSEYERLEEMHQQYYQCGSPDDIYKYIDEVDAYKHRVEKELELLEQYRKVSGDMTPAEIQKVTGDAVALVKEYQALGTVEEIDNALNDATKLVTEYKAIGTPEEITDFIGHDSIAVAQAEY